MVQFPWMGVGCANPLWSVSKNSQLDMKKWSTSLRVWPVRLARAEHEHAAAELDIGAEEHAVGMRHDEASHFGGFAADLGNARGGVDVEVRIRRSIIRSTRSGSSGALPKWTPMMVVFFERLTRRSNSP